MIASLNQSRTTETMAKASNREDNRIDFLFSLNGALPRVVSIPSLAHHLPIEPHEIACLAEDQAIQILLSSAPASLLAQKASSPSLLRIRFLFSSTLPRHHQT